MFPNLYFNKQYFETHYFPPVKAEIVIDGGIGSSGILKDNIPKNYDKLINISAMLSIKTLINTGLNADNNTLILANINTDSKFVDPNLQKRKENHLLLTKIILYT